MVNYIVRNLFGNYGAYLMLNFAKESFCSPAAMIKEHYRYFSGLVSGDKKPSGRLLFEMHSHSNFSDGAELREIVDFLFKNKINFWSLTDHNNSDGFDSLASGKYSLENYDIDVCNDGRSMAIRDGKQKLLILRSIEKKTDKGHISIHGYAGKFPEGYIRMVDAVRKGKELGGFVVINHPYSLEGICCHGTGILEEAIKAGADAIEINGMEIPPLIFGPVRVRKDAKRLGVPVITSGDAHSIDMYGKSGIAFERADYEKSMQRNNDNPADAIKELVTGGVFKTYLNYISPVQFLQMVRKGLKIKKDEY